MTKEEWTPLHHELFSACAAATDSWISDADDMRSREAVCVEAAVSVVAPIIEELQRQLLDERKKVANLEHHLNPCSTKDASQFPSNAP